MIMGNTMSPRDPNEDDEDEDEEEEDEEDEEDRGDEPPVVREPDEDLEHDAFVIGHSVSFGNSWRIRWAKMLEDFADYDADGFGRARGGLAQQVLELDENLSIGFRLDE